MNEEFQIKLLGKKDVLLFQKLIRLFQEVFGMEKLIEVEESYLIRLLEKPDFIAYGVIFGNEIVGGLTAYELTTYYSEDSEIFIYDIAVKPEFQRKGLGKQLLSSLKKYCKQNGISVLFVEVHEEDEHAVNFYHSTHGKAERVIHFNYYLDKEVGLGSTFFNALPDAKP
jgi:aminoglycoside 3-N-acetyltransferase I